MAVCKIQRRAWKECACVRAGGRAGVRAGSAGVVYVGGGGSGDTFFCRTLPTYGREALGILIFFRDLSYLSSRSSSTCPCALPHRLIPRVAAFKSTRQVP